MNNKRTVQSEYGILKKSFLKRPEDSFRSQDNIDSEWTSLNYLSRPMLNESIKEYQAFERLLQARDVEIAYFSANDEVTMDSIYCRDASIVTDYGVVLCNMGKELRAPEPQACKKDYEQYGLKVLGRIQSPGTIEGGDVAWLDQNTLAVGHGYRSNDEGFFQLKKILEPYSINVIQVELPHYKGRSDVFHLMSIISPVDVKKAVVYSPLMSVRFREELLSRGYELIEVPDEEFDSLGCNVLAVAPSVCIMVEGNPTTKKRLEIAGCEVLEYPGQNISVKGGGGPTCLTRPIMREMNSEKYV